MSKYSYNKNYFSCIDNEEKAYWLGFLYADGCIIRAYKDNDKNKGIRSLSLEMTLCEKDKKHLEKFNQCLNSNVKIYDKIVKYKNKEYKENRLCINCTQICNDLIKLGCFPCKTYSLKFPTKDIVPNIFMRDFLRGYFDGDGCICVGDSNNKKRIEISLTGMRNMLEEISEFLITNKIIRVNPKIYNDKRSKVSDLYLYGDMCKDFLDYIYKDSNIYLDRKYNKYLDYYKDYKESDYHGVCWSNRNKAYIVSIYINGKRKRIGQSKDLKKAIEMRKEAEIEKMNIKRPLN